MYKLTEIFGWINLIPGGLLFIATPFLNVSPFDNKGSLMSVLVILIAVSGALVYASRQKQLGTDMGEKAYPAALASYVLFMLIGSQWLTKILV